MLPRVIDLHAHILPGIDDGVRDLGEAVELARSAVADGVEALAATPHVRADYPTGAATMERGVAELRARLEAEEVPLRLLPGGELALEEAAALPEEELRRFGLGGSRRYVLVEFPYYGWPLALEQVLHRLAGLGLAAVVAHPERNESVQERPERLDVPLELGALVQVTCASLDGRIGRHAQRAGHALVRSGRAHLIASDAHAPGVREVGMSAAAQAVGGGALAEWLTRAVPAAVVAGEPPPPRPSAQRRRLRWGRA
jgi:protein-tyrosine phosphatase